MKGSTHLVFGLLLSALLTQIVGYERPVLAILLILFGSLLPDVDEKSSRFGRHVPIISYFTKHRTFFHSILFGVTCVVALSLLVEKPYVLAFVAGFSSHLLLDAMTPAGVKPFWPSNLKLSGFVRVGGLLEKTFFILLVLVFVWLLIN